MSDLFKALRDSVNAGRLVTSATVIAGEHLGQTMLFWPDETAMGTIGAAEFTQQVTERAQALMSEQRTERFSLEINDATSEIFVQVHVPAHKLIVVGAVHIAIHLVTFANSLGFHTTVVDSRSAFATPERFPHVDELVTQWPADALIELGIDESTCIVVLTHDEKLDNPALEVAVRSPARYIGALGSKRTHAKRVTALKEEGVSDEQIARIHAPIGLDLGGRKPDEIAVSIIAEIVSVRNGK